MTSYLHDPISTFPGFALAAWRTRNVTDITIVLVFALITDSRIKMPNINYNNAALYTLALLLKNTSTIKNSSGA